MKNLKSYLALLLPIASLMTIASCSSSNSNPSSPQNQPTNTPVITSTASNTATKTPTTTAVNTATNSPTSTPSATPTNSPTPTPSATPTNSPTDTPTDTATNSPTNTPSDTPTITPTGTPTPNPTQCATFTLFGDNTANILNNGPGQTGTLHFSVFNQAGPGSKTLWGMDTYLSTISQPVTLQAGIYNQATGALVAASAQQTVNVGSFQWVHFPINPPQTLVPGNYILGLYFVDTTAGYPYVGYDAIGANYHINFYFFGFSGTYPGGDTTYANTLNIVADVCP